MALVDWEAAWLDLAAHVRSKNSHGQRELTDLMADLTVEHRQVEGLPEKVGRVYLPSLVEELSERPATSDRVTINGNGSQDAHSSKP